MIRMVFKYITYYYEKNCMPTFALIVRQNLVTEAFKKLKWL